MGRPLAFLLTWTCRGTWLHGDERGSVDRFHNSPGTSRIVPSMRLVEDAAIAMTCEVVTLNESMRRIVEEAIRAESDHRGWRLYAVNVRTNHVHAVVAASQQAPEDILLKLKSWSTRQLREATLIGSQQPAWTRGGSKRYLWDVESLNTAIRYVVDGQGAAI